MSTKLTLTQEWFELNAEFKNIDVSLEQYFSALRGMLVASEWSQEAIDDYIIQMASEIEYSRLPENKKF